MGLVAAAGGGLALADLEELTDSRPTRSRSCSGLFSAGPLPVTTRCCRIPTTATSLLTTRCANRDSICWDNVNSIFIAPGCVRGPTAIGPDWPVTTPAYVLTGYFSMLVATGDTDRLVDLAADEARHERMRVRTGGDSAASTETVTALRYLAGAGDIDLRVIARIARHRDRLHTENRSIPYDLPAGGRA